MTPKQKKIATLRNRNLTNRQIAEKLGVSLPYINAVCMRLIREGEIEPREARKPRDPAVAKRNAKILAMFKSGVPSGEISDRLGVKRDIVYSYIAAMRTAGKVGKRKFGRPTKNTAVKKTVKKSAVKKAAKKSTAKKSPARKKAKKKSATNKR